MTLNPITVTARYLSADERRPMVRGVLAFTPPVVLPSLFEIRDVQPTWTNDGNVTWTLYSDTTQALNYTFTEQLTTGSRVLTLTVPQNVAAGTELSLLSLAGWSAPSGVIVENIGDYFAGNDLFPVPGSGNYVFPVSPMNASSSTVLNNGVLRLAGWVVGRTLSIARLGAEIVAAGDAGSKLRLGIYSDSGAASPGTLVLDAGTIAGDSVAVQEIALASPLTLDPGVYWIGAAVQLVTTTQPSVRIAGNWTPPFPISSGVSLPGVGATQGAGWQFTGITGSLPSTLSTASIGGTGIVPRVFVKVA